MFDCLLILTIFKVVYTWVGMTIYYLVLQCINVLMLNALYIQLQLCTI